MNRLILFVSLVLLCVCSTAEAQRKSSSSEKQPKLVFEVSEHDFGKISERAGKVSYDYVFENRGQGPLLILRVITACRCTKADFDKKPVQPGAKGHITVTYDPKKQSGVFYKAIQVYSNSPERRQIIILKGEVKP